MHAREALKATLMKVGASGDDRAGDGDGYDSRAESSSDADDDDAVAPGAVSEFGTTWMMLDGWVTRATFAYVSADDTLPLSSSSSSPDVSSRTESSQVDLKSTRLKKIQSRAESGRVLPIPGHNTQQCHG